MARRLVNLVDINGELHPDDQIYFTFKQHRFTAKISSAGLIHDVTWAKPNGLTCSVFEMRSFESLTDFTETCIQEKLDEYHTRYSAWRRVRHSRTGKPMEQIYKDYTRDRLISSKEKLSGTEYQQLLTLQEEKMLVLQKTIEKLKEKQQTWTKWFEKHHPNEKMPVEKTKEPKPPVQAEAVQPIVLDSPSGTYLVIQRMKEVAPNAVANIQSLGLNGFRKMTEKFVKENQTWNPPSSIEDWWKKSVSEINQDPRLIARTVHEFFKPN